MRPNAIVYAGFPGAGKSVAAQYGAEFIGGTHVSMGAVVKTVANQLLGPEATSHEIGAWASHQRENHGPDIMAQHVLRAWAETGPPDPPLHIEGARSVAEVEAFEAAFGDIPIIFVDASETERLARLRNRARDGEGSFGSGDLAARDTREIEWGLVGIEAQADYRLDNDHQLSTLQNRVATVLETLLAFSPDA